MKNSLLFFLFSLFFMTINVHGQSRWQAVDSVKDQGIWPIDELKCYDSLNCIYRVNMQGAGGYFFRRTTDGGNTWKTVYMDSSYFHNINDYYFVPDLYDISYPNEKLFIAVGDSGLIVRSTDKGETWESYRTDTNIRNYHLTMYNENIGSMFSASLIKNNEFYFCTTTDGGKTWDRILYPKWPTRNQILALGEEHYFSKNFFVGYTTYKFSDTVVNNYLIYVHNNWESWDSVRAPSLSTYFSFGDENNVWTAGSKNVLDSAGWERWRQYIYHSSDGGHTWEKQWDTVYKADVLNDIEFYDKDFGMAGGNSALTLITYNGGKTWNIELIKDTPPDGSSKSVRFIQIPNRHTAYVVYNQSYIYKWSGTPPTEVEEEQGSGIKISPNPATDYIEITFSDVILSEAKNPFLNVKVYDLLGAEVLVTRDSRFRGNDTQVLRLDVSALPSGVYFVRVGTKMYKFVKM